MENHTTNINNDDRVQYEPPAVTTIGDIDDLTHGNTSGGFTDASFPTDTPFADLTFS